MVEQFLGLSTSILQDPRFFTAAINATFARAQLGARKGVRLLSARPAGKLRCEFRGLLRAKGYTDSYQPVEQLLGVVTERLYNPSAPPPPTTRLVEIHEDGSRTNKGNMPEGDWAAFTFDEGSYWINPAATSSLWSYRIGSADAPVPAQNSEYTDPPTDYALTAESGSPLVVPYPDVSAITFSSTDQLKSSTKSIDPETGNYKVVSTDNDNGVVGRTIVGVTFGSPADLSKHRLAHLKVETGPILPDFTSKSQKLELNVNGEWVALANVHIEGLGSTSGITLSADLRQILVRTNILGFRVTLVRQPKRGVQNKLAFELRPIQFGESYLSATAEAKRPWDKPEVNKETSYAARAKILSSAVVSANVAVIQNAAFMRGPSALGTSYGVGNSVTLNYSGYVGAGGFVKDPAGTSVVIEWLRKDDAGNWHVLGTSPNDEDQTWIDRLEYWEVLGRPTAQGVTYDGPDAPPPFTSKNLRCGFAYKGRVVWGFAGGKSNVRHSRVGKPYDLYTDENTYEEGDVGRPSDWTLADNLGDEPVCGIQAGQIALLLGRDGAYAQAGDYSADMTPLRRIPGSTGAASRWCLTAYRGPDGSMPGAAWCDPHGNVWFVAGNPSFASDSSAEPIELSASIRGLVRSFLGEDLEKVQVVGREDDGSLWVVLGRRALVLRPQDPAGLPARWEQIEWDLTLGKERVGAPDRDWLPATSETQTSSTPLAVWTLGGALASDGIYTQASFASYYQTKRLIERFSPPVPSTGPFLGVDLLIQDRKQGGFAVGTFDFKILTGEGQQTITLNGSAGQARALTVGGETSVYAFDAASLGPAATASLLGSGVRMEVAYQATPAPNAHLVQTNWRLLNSHTIHGNIGFPSAPSLDVPGAGYTTAGYPQGTSSSFGFSCGTSISYPNDDGITSWYNRAHDEGTVTHRWEWAPTGIYAGAPPPETLEIEILENATAGTGAWDDPNLGCSASVAVGGDNPVYSDILINGHKYGRKGTSTYRRTVPVVGGVATFTTSKMTADAKVTFPINGSTSYWQYPPYASVGINSSSTPIVPSASTTKVQVDRVAVRWRFDESIDLRHGRSDPAFAAYSDGVLYAATDKGTVDSLDVGEGYGRDRGNAMPASVAWMHPVDGPNRRLERVRPSREGRGELEISCRTERGETSATVDRDRAFARFGTGARGRRMELGVEVREGMPVVQAIEEQTTPLGPEFTR